jgi:AcrR family transcriptional regulator
VYHDEITVSSQADPRANQKERTKTALLEAALDLLREDVTPTIPAAAEKAKVSRATAYRYFPTQDSLLQEIAQQHPAVATVDEVVDALETDDVAERLLALLDAFNPIVIADETHMRTALRTFQENWLSARRDQSDDMPAPFVRSRRRMRWLDEVLRPLEPLTPENRERLRAALALTLGIDSIVILKDVCELDDERALEVLRWAALALLRAGLDETGAST